MEGHTLKSILIALIVLSEFKTKKIGHLVEWVRKEKLNLGAVERGLNMIRYTVWNPRGIHKNKK